ncbi:FCD domain-containing protein, partial [Planococcus sp. SIMBA_143]
PLFNALQNIVGEANAAANIGTSVSHDHSALFDAIVRRDSMAAMSLMRQHLDSVSEYYRSRGL